MKTYPLLKGIIICCLIITLYQPNAKAQVAKNPIIYADVPDMSIIRVGNTYYMSSTTMHMSPGVPIMKSKDMVNWQLVNYACDILDNTDELSLNNGKSTYGKGSWASSLRFHNNTYYVSTFSGTTGTTYIYSTKNIERGPWKKIAFKPSLHDHSLFFDDDGKIYMVYGSGKIMLAELADDLSGIKPGTQPQVIIENADLPTGANGGLPAEGSQLFKVNGKYYLFNINWPRGGMRTVILHRAANIKGPYEGRIALQDKGVAQGGIVNTPNGKWYAYLFRDAGAVGRIPYLVPVTWKDEWPILGTDGKVPDALDLPANRSIILGIVSNDEFNKKNAPLILPWQWNHNPDNKLWTLTERPGYLRLKADRIDTSVLMARNTLTQRTFGPTSSAITAIDVSHLRNGDCTGLVLLQKNYGWVGIKAQQNGYAIVMVSGENGSAIEKAQVPAQSKNIFLRADCDFNNRTDKGYFYYSLDGKTWTPIGEPLKMAYTLPHFMGYRFGLFNFSTKNPGGYADFDFFHISDSILKR